MRIKKITSKIALCTLVAVATLSVYTIVNRRPPADFPIKQFYFTIPSGQGIIETSENLYDAHLIRSPLFFQVLGIILSFNKGFIAGDYVFKGEEDAFSIAKRMIKGELGLNRIKVTIPEGADVDDIAFILLKAIPNFNAPRFVSLAKKEEGYLYPDTYFFFENVTAEKIIQVMKSNFDKKIATLETEIIASGKPLKDIVIMASLVEKETNGEEDRRIIAGILWKRIDKGMPLQVDAPFYYIMNKTGNVTYDDLKIDSPYNTYKYKGLPIGPIDNPSIEAIKATVSPIPTKYYFYLSDKKGITRFGITYDDHLSNISKYLR